ERILYNGPMVVHVSRVSASASEILAGALKDYHRAVITGDDHTFGKGTVQTVTPLSPGLGALKITTARFFPPRGQSTQSDGAASPPRRAGAAPGAVRALGPVDSGALPQLRHRVRPVRSRQPGFGNGARRAGEGVLGTHREEHGVRRGAHEARRGEGPRRDRPA